MPWYICLYYTATIFAVRPDEATEPPGASEKSEAGAVLQKQSQKETKSSDDCQQAELTLPSQVICISYKVSLCIGPY